MIRETIIKILKKVSGEDCLLSFLERDDHGDLSTNIALIKGKENPRGYAQGLVKKLQKDTQLSKLVKKIEVAGPGFINFWLDDSVLEKALKEILEKKEKYGRNKTFLGKNVMVEFAHPNTHKLFHIGHLRNIATGEAISRILELNGAKVARVNYQGDVGLHIAKALWGVNKLGFKDPKDIQKRVELLAKAYVEGNKAYEEEKKAKTEIEEINKKIYQSKDAELGKLYQTTRKWSLEYFDKIYNRVGTSFDKLYFESQTAGPGKEIALKALKKGVLHKSKGAIIFPGSKYGLHDRVFVTGQDVSTYEAKDLGLAEMQFNDFKPDLILHIVSKEQSDYFKVIFKALELINLKTKGKEVHLVYGWVNSKEGKMSSRKGNVILGEWLLDEAKKRILEKHKTNQEIAEKVAVGAVKYSFLKVGMNQDISFDINESISLQGNSGPYLQYTFARGMSVLGKAKEKINKINIQSLEKEEMLILRSLVKYPEIIKDAMDNYSPNIICNYLYDLAQKYNNFYNKHKIIGGENQELKLALTQATTHLIKSGLNLLGIEAPDKM